MMSETRDFEWDVMIDLETLSTRPDAAILAIGAWPFRLDGGPVYHEPFYANVDIETASGAAIGGAFYWWLKQSEEARARLAEPKPISLWMALDLLSAWLGKIGGPEKAFRIWAHGENFDIPILEHSYNLAGRSVPWKYNAARDTRTLFHAAGIDWDAEMKALSECAHYALDDARVQAALVKKAWAVLHS